LKEEIEKDPISPSVETVNNLKKNITKSLNQKLLTPKLSDKDRQKKFQQIIFYLTFFLQTP